MEKILHSLKAPFKKGILVGLADTVFRLFSLMIWFVTASLLFRFIWEALFLISDSSQRIWWFTYSMMMFVMVTVLAYTAVWDRE